jgi:redox-sensitive bicupin YhaK (pirin superfamily)
MANKKVRTITYAHEVDMGGIPVMQPLPTRQVDQVDPFILLHHAIWEVKEGTDHRHAGVGPHPHRGFSPVTFIYQGAVHHRDSRGNDSVVHEGGVQWMHAGAGIMHSERPPKEVAENGGTQEIIQLWINTAQSQKMEQPVYNAITKEDMQVIESENMRVQVVSGELNGVQGSIQGVTPVTSAMWFAQESGEFKYDVPDGMHAILYILAGKIKLDGHGEVEERNMIAFGDEGETVSFTALEESKGLILMGKPLEEPIETYGPFVMTNQTEIMEAMRDFQMGKMGVLVEEFD